MQFEALVNLYDKTVCKCAESRVTVRNKCPDNKLSDVGHKQTDQTISTPKEFAGAYDPDYDDVTIFAITPTYSRLTQKVDLTSLCYNVQNVPNFIWIVVEDSKTKTNVVAKLLERCPVS